MVRKTVIFSCSLAVLLMIGKVSVAGEDDERTLEEVVVTATRTPLLVSEAPQNVELITREDIEDAGGRLDNALDRLPALRVNRAGSPPMASLPTIRGSQPGEVLVLINGRRLNSQQSGWFNLSDLPVSASLVESIEVLEDSSSALYGAEAMGGVINIITRDPAMLPGGAGLSFQTGSFDTRGGEGFFFGSTPAGGLAVLARRDITGGFRENSDAAESRLNIHASFPGEAVVFDFSMDFLKKELGSPGLRSYPTPRARQYDDTNIYGFRCQYAPADTVFLTADAFWNRYRREYDDPDLGLHSRHVTHTGGFSLQGVIEDTSTGRWMAGAETIWDDVDSTNDGSHELERYGFFLQDEIRLDPVSFILTGRYDYFSVFDNQFSPRMAVVYSPDRNISLRASVARGYRTPTFDDLYWEDPFASGNPDLEPERSWNYELGASGASSWGTVWMGNLFRRDVDNLINWQDPDGDWVYSPENIASARISGFSADLKQTLRAGGDFYLSYTFLRPEDRDRDGLIGGRPRHMVKAGLGVPLWLMDADVSISWIDRYPVLNLEDESYWTTGLRLSRTFSPPGAGDVELSVSIDNVLDREYEVVPGYPMPGRAFSFNAGWSY